MRHVWNTLCISAILLVIPILMGVLDIGGSSAWRLDESSKSWWVVNSYWRTVLTWAENDSWSAASRYPRKVGAPQPYYVFQKLAADSQKLSTFIAVGWPFRCFVSDYSWDIAGGKAVASLKWGWGLGGSKDIISDSVGGEVVLSIRGLDRYIIPFKPIWFGLIGNILVVMLVSQVMLWFCFLWSRARIAGVTKFSTL